MLQFMGSQRVGEIPGKGQLTSCGVQFGLAFVDVAI